MAELRPDERPPLVRPKPTAPVQAVNLSPAEIKLAAEQGVLSGSGALGTVPFGWLERLRAESLSPSVGDSDELLAAFEKVMMAVESLPADSRQRVIKAAAVLVGVTGG